MSTFQPPIPLSIQTSGAVPSFATITQPVLKSKVRYIIVRDDLTTMVLAEKAQITPREMIGLSKLLGLINVFMILDFGQSGSGYNIEMHWSQFVENLGIRKHFDDGPELGKHVPDEAVLDIFLYDPSDQ